MRHEEENATSGRVHTLKSTEQTSEQSTLGLPCKGPEKTTQTAEKTPFFPESFKLKSSLSNHCLISTHLIHHHSSSAGISI